MTPKRWAIAAWGVFLASLFAVAGIYGGRDCQVPRNGPLAGLMAGRTFVKTRYWKSGGCREVHQRPLFTKARRPADASG